MCDCKKPRKTRKELKAEIRELTGRVEELEIQLDAKESRITSARQRELEEHINQMGQDAYKYRQMIRDIGIVYQDGFAKQLFHLVFDRDLDETDVELTPVEMAKVFPKE